LDLFIGNPSHWSPNNGMKIGVSFADSISRNSVFVNTFVIQWYTATHF
jgi:hypothetical protein